MLLPLAKVPFIMGLVAVIWGIAGILLILIILVQKGKGGGLGAAFGGAGSTSLLGTKTGDFLTWVTISLVSIFLVFSVVMAKYYRPSDLAELRKADTSLEQVDESMLIDDQATEEPQAGDVATPDATKVQDELDKTVKQVEKAATEATEDATTVVEDVTKAAEATANEAAK